MAVLEQDHFRALHYLPGQVLVTLRRAQRVEGNTPEFAAHRALQQELNEMLKGRVVLEAGDPRYFRNEIPAVRFTTKEATTEIHSYRFDDGGYPQEIPAKSRVPDVLRTLNEELRRRGNRVGDLGTVQVVSPNWLAAPAQGWGTGGGPGLPPVPVPPQPPLPRTTFSFANPALSNALEAKAARTQPVVVAVLDTSPVPDAAKMAGEHYREQAGNTALAEVVGKTIFHDGPLPSGVLAEFEHLVPFWANRMDRWQPTSDPANRNGYYNIVDHGLFVAGVVQSIAPDAEVHLYRVLDDVGVGSLAALLAALNALFEDFLKGDDAPRLIVNLSLLIEEVPPTSRSKTLKGDDPYAPLFAAIEALRERGVLIVAAAGNDSLDLTTGKAKRARRDPRLPARHNLVLSVAAVDQHDKPATYSNRSDSDAVPNGIAIFGGNATIDPVTKEPEILDPAPMGGQPPVDPPPVGIVGVFSNRTLPCDKGPNETGLVYWAGTSFATPVISGLAARRWSQLTGGATAPDDVIVDLDGFTSATVTALGCAVIKAHQPQ